MNTLGADGRLTENAGLVKTLPVLCGVAVAQLAIYLFNTHRGGERLSLRSLAGFVLTVAGAAVPTLRALGVPLVLPLPLPPGAESLDDPLVLAVGAPLLVVVLFAVGLFDEGPPEAELTFAAEDEGAAPVASRGSDWPCAAGCDKHVHAQLEQKRALRAAQPEAAVTAPVLGEELFKPTGFISPLAPGSGGLLVDLDLPPEERWAQIAGDPQFAAEMRRVLDCLFTRFLQGHIARTLPGRLYSLLRNLTLRFLPRAGYGIRNINRGICRRAGLYDPQQTGPLERMFGEEYAAEMRGLAKAAGLDLADVLAANGDTQNLSSETPCARFSECRVCVEQECTSSAAGAHRSWRRCRTARWSTAATSTTPSSTSAPSSSPSASSRAEPSSTEAR